MYLVSLVVFLSSNLIIDLDMVASYHGYSWPLFIGSRFFINSHNVDLSLLNRYDFVLSLIL